MMGSESSRPLTAASCPAAPVWTIGTTTSPPVLITNCDICASCVSAPNWCRILDGYATTLSISDKIVRRGLTSVDGGPTHTFDLWKRPLSDPQLEEAVRRRSIWQA